MPQKSSKSDSSNLKCGNRTAVIAGARTPFVKAGTSFSSLSLHDLACHSIKSLIENYELDASSVDELVYGTVLLDPRTPNLARELVFKAGLPHSINAHFVSNNCITGLVAASMASGSIFSGNTEVAIAGGVESMSNPALLYNDDGQKVFLNLSRARSFSDKVKALGGLRPNQLLPAMPGVKEPSTGLSMGQHMEITAKEMSIPRDKQDELALKSHQNAASAIEAGHLDGEVFSLEGVEKDSLVRPGTSLEKLSGLRTVFDRSEAGTLTAGNSSALTDGASAVLLMSEARAEKESREPLAFIKDFEYAAIDPNDGLLMAPALAVPRLLKKHGLTFEDFDMIEIHEAFAAQVLANVKAWEEGWKEDAVGKVDWSKVNMLGGSIALGHPFAATGGRIIATMANHMKRNYLKRGLISICAAGAMAGAMILERE